MLSLLSRSKDLVCESLPFWPFTLGLLVVAIVHAAVFVVLFRIARKRFRGLPSHRRSPVESRVGYALAIALCSLIPYALVGRVALARKQLRDENPPWHRAEDPSEAVAAQIEARLASVPAHVKRLLSHWYDDEALFCWRGAVDRLHTSDMIVLKATPTQAQRNRVESSYRASLLLAETHDGSRVPICLYTKMLLDEFELSAHTPEAQSNVLGYVCLHELIHLPAFNGGVFHSPVSGDHLDRSDVVRPDQRHVALNVWLAELARLDYESALTDEGLSSEERQARLDAASFEIRRVARLVGPGGAYASAAKKWADDEPIGPPSWGIRTSVAFPAGWK